MNSKKTQRSVIKHPPDTQFILHLIREELKIRKFFNTLRSAGLEDCFYEPDLSFLILKSLGLNDGKDETYYRYSDLMDKHSSKMKANQDSIKSQTLKVYAALTQKAKSLD